MVYLTALNSTGPDYIAIAMVTVLLIVAVAMTVKKYLKGKKPMVEPQMDFDLKVQIEDSASEEAPGTAGKLKIYDVEPKTAAMLMAIVADKTQLPLNELRFTYIKEIK